MAGPTPDDYSARALQHLIPTDNGYGAFHTPSWNAGEPVQRAMQVDAAIGTGLALLAVHQELAELRAELRELTAAVVKAAEPIAAAADELPTISAALDQLADLGPGLDGIAAAVESLTPVPPAVPARRTWLGFGRRTQVEGVA